jgi:hypothetical protein
MSSSKKQLEAKDRNRISPGRISKYTLLLFFSFALSGALTSPINSQEDKWLDLVVTKPSGFVNWTTRTMTAVGHGLYPGSAKTIAQKRALSIVAARKDAQRNLLLIASGIDVDDETRVLDFVKKNKEFKLKLEGFIRNAEVISEKSDDANEISSITMRMPIDGVDSLNAILLSDKVENIKIQKERNKGSDEADGNNEEIVIDARNTGLSPAMFPVVYDESNQVLYDLNSVDVNAALTNGLGVYVVIDDSGNVMNPLLRHDFEKFALTDYIRPLLNNGIPTSVAFAKESKKIVFKATGASGKNKVNVILSDEDSKKIRSSAEIKNALKSCKITFIVDKRVAGKEGRMPNWVPVKWTYSH